MIIYGNNKYLTVVHSGNISVITRKTYFGRNRRTTGYLFILVSQIKSGRIIFGAEVVST